MPPAAPSHRGSRGMCPSPETRRPCPRRCAERGAGAAPPRRVSLASQPPEEGRMTIRAGEPGGKTDARARTGLAGTRRASATRAAPRPALILGVGLALALAGGACRGAPPPAVAVAPPTLVTPTLAPTA